MRSSTSAKVRSSSSGSWARTAGPLAGAVGASLCAWAAPAARARHRARPWAVLRKMGRCCMGKLRGCEMARSALRAAPLGRVARATLLANGEVQRGNVLPATAANGGDGITGGDDVAGLPEQSLIVAIQAQVAAAVVENQQQAGAAQPFGKYHLAAVYGAYRLAGAGADQHTVPGGARIFTTLRAKAGDQTALHRPGQLAAGLVEGAAVIARRRIAQPGRLVGGGQAAL